MEAKPSLLGLITLKAESRSRWLTNLVPLPPCSPRLIAGPEPGPRLNLSLLHVSSWCCFFHEHIQEIKKVGKDLGIAPTIIRDEELKTRGFGGEWEPGPCKSCPQGTGQGTVGGTRAVGHMVCCPKLHPERNWFVSNPETRSWEADCLWGRKEAVVQILIHIWKL